MGYQAVLYGSRQVLRGASDCDPGWEEMGFYRTGEAWHGLDAGELAINGRFAVNPSGGMKARGHPIGICGLSSVAEIYDQLTRAAGNRQHTPANLGMIQSAGGVSRTSYVFILDTID